MAADQEIVTNGLEFSPIPAFTALEWNGLVESLASIFKGDDRLYRNYLGWFIPLTFQDAAASADGDLHIQLSSHSAMHLQMAARKIIPQAESELSALLDSPVHIELILDTGSEAATSPSPAPANLPRPTGTAVRRAPSPQENPVLPEISIFRSEFPPEAPKAVEPPPGSDLMDEEGAIGSVEAATGHNEEPGSPTEKPAELPPGREPGWKPLTELLVAPEYSTYYDEVVSANAAVYLPAYMLRHIRHMDPSDGLRYLALRQIAYLRGFNGSGGIHMVLTTKKELSRWSTLQSRSLPGNLDNPASYLSLLASRTSYASYFNQVPSDRRWEDEAGYHWRVFDREYVLWKKASAAHRETCSQVFTNPSTGEKVYKSAPAVYRVLLSTPLTPEDNQSLRQLLLDGGIKTDPLNAVRRILSIPRAQVIPDQPLKIIQRPDRLQTVQELVLELWGGSSPELKSQLYAQAKVLETYLLNPERDLLKIPHYLLRGYGRRLTPAQLWTLIVLQDRVYTDARDGTYRDTTTIRGGYREMSLWTSDEYKKTTTRKIGRWLNPFASSHSTPDGEDQFSNPWFSLFVSKTKVENTPAKNADQTRPLHLRVLPLVPLTPEDTLRFIYSMGVRRLMLRDAVGRPLALRLSEGTLTVLAQDGKQWEYTLAGDLVGPGQPETIDLSFRDENLGGCSFLAATGIDADVDAPDQPGALSCTMDKPASALFRILDNSGSALSCTLGCDAGAHFCTLSLGPGALYCVILKLLILNLYGFNQNSFSNITPPIQSLGSEIDSLEQFGQFEGQYVRWTADESLQPWSLSLLCSNLRISDTAQKRLISLGVQPRDLLAGYLQLLSVPADRFTSSREHVLVAKLTTDPHGSPGGAYDRLAGLPPRRFKGLLRKAIFVNYHFAETDRDWQAAMTQVPRDELIALVEKLSLGAIIVDDEPDPAD